MIELFNGIVYNFGSVSSIKAIVKYEKQRDNVDMKYRFYYKVYLSGSGARYQNNVKGSFILNGTTVWEKNTKNSGTNWSYEFTSDWFTVENKVDASVTIPFKFTIKDTQNSSWCNYTSSTYQLIIDAAGSDFKTVPNFNIGQPFSITTTKYNENSYDKLVIKLGTTTIKTINGLGTTTQIDFTSSELNTIYGLTANVPNADFTFELSTYENQTMATPIGVAKSIVSKGYIIASNPIITNKSAVDINSSTTSLTNNNQNVIKGFSNIEVNVIANGQNQATIKSITVNNQGATNGKVTFNQATTNVFNIVVTDSRGFSTTDSITLTLIDYIQLSLNVNIERNQPTDNQVKISYSGNYFNGNFGSVANTLSVQYRFKVKGQTFTDSDTWTSLNPTISDNTFSQKDFLIGDVDYQNIYEFQVRAVDQLLEKRIIEIYIPKGETIFNWDDKSFNVNVDTTLKKNLKVGNKITVDDFDIDRKGIGDFVYPVGSIYMSINNTNPTTLFGGTWVQLKDMFLLGAGDTYENGATGGSATHTLTIEEMPIHSHQEKWVGNDGNVNPLVRNTGEAESAGIYRSSQTSYYNNNNKKAAVRTADTGGGLPHDNMPPYLVVYMWKRTK